MKKAIFLAVITITLILGFSYFSRGDRSHSKVVKTRYQLELLSQALQMFKLDTGRYPTQTEGLRALVHQPKNTQGWTVGGYLETREIPKDDWDNDYIYKTDPNAKPPFEIISLGADGIQGGEGQNADLSTRQIYLE